MLQRAALLQVQSVGEHKMFFRLFYATGIFYSSSNMAFWKNIRTDRRAVDELLVQGRTYSYATQAIPDSPFQARVIYRRIGPSIMLQMGYSLEAETRLLQSFQRIFTISMIALLGLAVVVGWFMARRALGGVATVTRTARRISEDDLETRVPVFHQHNEIDQLAVTFNQMLDRIQHLVVGIRQMNDNIAHDLRSPITRIRGLAEVTLGGANLAEYQNMAASTIEECDRLLHMINTMLTISRTEAGIDPKSFQRVDLSALAHDAGALFQPLAEDKGIVLQVEAQSACPVHGNASMLQRLLANLIDNAIKYTPPGGRVRVGVAWDAGIALLTVEDTGAGIAPEDHPKIFERFFRGDQSRSQDGAGLGLSLAQVIARAHGGEIALASRPGQGSLFTLRLPMGGNDTR
ncbi:MAG: HAMP domain-containing protein [Desulfatitalea sp.]|nr:HAMP domain-containing protein [Desulfatitalea sp.]